MKGTCGTAALLLAASLFASEARASSIDAQGQLVYSPGALMTFGFESLPSAQGVGASWLTWGTGTSASLVGTAVSTGTWTSAIVMGPDALEGTSALRIDASSGYLGLGLLDASLFKQIGGKRVVVSMWGRSFGAEPELDVVVPSNSEPIGPSGFGHVVAVRTGNETSDGWAEYSTGPIDGSLWGFDVAAIILTARYATYDSTYALDSSDLYPPSSAPAFADPTGYAVVDAVEVAPATGSVMTPATCTPASVASTCGAQGTCIYGHCVDSSFSWGPVPSPAMQQELVQRWEFTATRLGSDRNAAAGALDVFSASNVAAVEAAVTPRTFFQGMSQLVAGLRDGHTTLGLPPSGGTFFYPYLDPFEPEPSGLLDLCFGLADDDLPGGSAGPVYAVFWMSPTSALTGTIQQGAILSQVDGMTPDDWLTSIEAGVRPMLPNDPTSEPAGRALLLSRAIDKYAQSVVFSSCTAAGACTEETVPVGTITYEELTGTGYTSATWNTRPCTGRFLDAVSTWTPADDDATYDVPQVEMSGGIASIEVDGFAGAYDSASSKPYHAWEDPFSTALSAGTGVLIDFRLGHGGKFLLGAFLAENIRGTGDPYGAFAAPRGAFDEIDPPWVLDPSLAACVFAVQDAPNVCGWTGANSDQSVQADPPGAANKIAWLDDNDLSMNDITPKKLVGAANFRIFGPHPTTGAYGEITSLPPILGAWTSGSIQTLDMRFASSLPLAISGTWASGIGVPPDQVVLQKMSDLLAGQDTMLAAAKAWLATP